MSNELEKQLESAKNQLSSLNAEIDSYENSYESQDRFNGYYMMNYHDKLILNDLYSSRDDLEQEIALLEKQLRRQKELERKRNESRN